MNRRWIETVTCALAALALAACEGAAGGSEDERLGEISDPLAEAELGPLANVATGVERLPVPTLAEGEVYEIELGDHTDYIDGHEGIEAASFDGLETVTVRPRAGAKLGFGVGRILLSRDGLFARKVVSVKKSGGAFQFKTVPATLAEIYKKLRIEGNAVMTEVIPKTPAKSDSGYGTMASALKIVWADISDSTEKTKSWSWDTKVVDTKNLDVTIGGDFALTYKFYLKIYIASGDQDVFKSYVRLEADSDVWAKLQAKAAASTGDKEKSFASWELAWSFGAVSGLVDMDLVMNYSASVGGDVTATMDVGFDNMVYKVGAEWKEDEGWSKISEYETPTWHKSFDVDVKAQVSARLQPAVEAAVLIYGLAGPEIAVGPEIQGDITVQSSSSSTDVCADVDVVLKAEANFVVDLFGLLELVEKNFGSWNIVVWKDVYNHCWSL